MAVSKINIYLYNPKAKKVIVLHNKRYTAGKITIMPPSEFKDTSESFIPWLKEFIKNRYGFDVADHDITLINKQMYTSGDQNASPIEFVNIRVNVWDTLITRNERDRNDAIIGIEWTNYELMTTYIKDQKNEGQFVMIAGMYDILRMLSGSEEETLVTTETGSTNATSHKVTPLAY